MDKLNLCHTQADVEHALQELPVGMEALYDRMALSIAQNPSDSDRALALDILQCVTSSLRLLTVADLSQALNEDTSKMLDFERTVLDVCGGFVVIDNGGHVAMIHQTAREYLLSSDDCPFHIDRSTAHRHMFLSCMRRLMLPGLRGMINRNQLSEFFDYAAIFWSAHLSSSPPNCREVADALHKFLAGQWVLTWIHILAASKRLHVLVQGSKHLSKHSAKRDEYDTSRSAKDKELVENWATDLVKIVGKFGTTLRRNPESIYKSIPPFCPQNSSIFQQFGKAESHSLKVSGLSNKNWDDSLARLSLGFGTFASSIAAAGSQIAILAPAGNVFVYDSSVFEELAASPIKHGERVYRMELSSSGTVLATYGYRTTKIWEVFSGKCKISVQNLESRPRPLTMLLTNDNSILLVGTDDRRIRSLDLTEPSPTWQVVAELEEPELEGHYLNAASYMALNKDGSLVAVAYRGHPLSAWETNGSDPIGHCWRTRERVARGEVISAMWHPHLPEVLGLYLEGVVFKWRPYDGESEEIATGASKIAMSGDGNLFVAGDVHGTVKVYTTSDACLLYQLASQDTVLGLAFSPDLRRFYDIRGYYGNAWEPNALMRYAGQLGKGAEGEGETDSLGQGSVTSVSWAGRVDSITALAGSPVGRLYCFGTEKGTVSLHDEKHGKLSELHGSRSFLSIERMSWSSDGRSICFSDSGKTVFIMSMDLTEPAPAVEKRAEIPLAQSTKGPVLQLLFQPDSTQLLVYTSSTLCIFSLETSSVVHSIEWHTADCKWIIHPHDSTLIVGIGPGAIHILDWDLTEHQTYQYDYSSHSLPADSGSAAAQDTVDRVLVTHDKNHLLVQISLLSQNSKEKAFLYFETSSITISKASSNDAESPSLVSPVTIPQEMSSQIALPLSFLAQNRLIFLSRSFSICSWQLPPKLDVPLSRSSTAHSNKMAPPGKSRRQLSDGANLAELGVKQLFFLPGDWISRDCLAMCSIWRREKSLLCPRNGEVGVVRCAGLA